MSPELLNLLASNGAVIKEVEIIDDSDVYEAQTELIRRGVDIREVETCPLERFLIVRSSQAYITKDLFQEKYMVHKGWLIIVLKAK